MVLAPPRPETAKDSLHAQGLLDRAAWWVMLGTTLLLGAIALFGVWFVAWLLASSLFGFLLGPGNPLAPDAAPWAVVVGPPVLATAATAWWLWRRRRAGTLRFPSPPAALLPTRLVEVADLPRWLTALALLAGSAGFLLYGRLVYQYHRIHGAVDEGMYLYAGRLVMEGKVPLRDFYFDQGPLFPFVVGPLLAPFGYDERAARILAIVCALLAMLVTYLGAARLGGRLAGVLAFGLLVTNLDFITEISAGILSNGSITTLVVALGGLALAWDRPLLALVLTGISSGFRQTLVPVPAVIGAYVAFVKRRPLAALLTGLAVVFFAFGIFLLIGGERAAFGLFRPLRTDVVERWAALPKGPRFTVIEMRDMTLQVIPAYLPFFVTAIASVYVVATRAHREWRILATLGASSLLVLLVNVSPYPGNPRYPVSQLPLLAILNGVSLAVILRALLAHQGSRFALAPVGTVLALMFAAAPTLATRQAGFVEEYLKRPPVERLIEVSDYLKTIVPPGGTVLAMETPFATQAGLRVPPGLEAGSWGVVRGWDEERARRVGVVTYEMLIKMVEQQAGDVLIDSDRYGMLSALQPQGDERDRMRDAIGRYYNRAREFESVSDWGTVRVYVKDPNRSVRQVVEGGGQ